MSFYYHLKLKDFLTAIDLQLLLYILAVAESLLYGLVIITYIGALIAFRKAEVNYNDDEFETSKLLEVEAMVQIFGIAMFFIVSVVMVGGVKENDHNKLLPYLLLCITQIIAVIIYSIFICPSWFYVIFVTLKLTMFMLTYTLYRRLVNEVEERKCFLDYDEKILIE
ncbi:unnamed protein product [Chironomus riparius]|uniref:Uncharacterized protein n=1 Tax=Chironomus riparius TaxID=315576 RepID=A0A9N9SBG7_9DIPT|nr:unnamed protein product [Chironomus riparius]